MTELERLVGVEREAPGHLLRELRVIDPTAELLYVGDGEWWLGQVISDERIRDAGRRGLQRARVASRLLSVLEMKKKLPRELLLQERRQLRAAHLMATARCYGFRPTCEYFVVGEPTAAIVRDQEVMDFLHRTLSAQEISDLEERDELKAKAEAHAELTDDYRAVDAWRYMFTRQHAMKDIRASDRARSGFTRHQLTGAVA